ncbi:unnamed protein product [Ixodes persulcatus]
MISACCSPSCACATGSMCCDDRCPKTTLRPHNQNTRGGSQQLPGDTDKYRSTKDKDTTKKKNKRYVSLSHPNAERSFRPVIYSQFSRGHQRIRLPPPTHHSLRNTVLHDSRRIKRRLVMARLRRRVNMRLREASVTLSLKGAHEHRVAQ